MAYNERVNLKNGNGNLNQIEKWMKINIERDAVKEMATVEMSEAISFSTTMYARSREYYFQERRTFFN